MLQDYRYKWLFWVLVGLLLVSGCSTDQQHSLDNILAQRPDQQQVVFDYVGTMDDLRESTTKALADFRNRHQIELLIVVLPSLGRQYTISEAAALLFSKWQVGRAMEGGGVLLLLVDESKEVKLEISYELEPIFTDLFTGAVERRQLQSRFVAGELEIGLIAVMEELEARAQVLHADIAVADAISKRDARYLSQGAGARIALEPMEVIDVSSADRINTRYPAGKSIDDAWHTLLKRWKDQERDPFLQVFLPTGRLAYRDFATMPKERLTQQYQTYSKRAYQVLEDGNHGVISFGKKEGWNNAPFLFCRTDEGWQFDLVNQKRFIRMGPSPSWGVEFGAHPYMLLLWDAFRFYGQDIPLTGEEVYKIGNDRAIAATIETLEKEVAAGKEDFATLLKLGRLYTLTSMSRKAMQTLKKAIVLQPQDPRPYRYLAIVHVNGFYQYDSALKALQTARDKGGNDTFLANFSGYIFYQKKQYQEAAAAFEKAAQLDQENSYSQYYLAYTYAWLYSKTKGDSEKKEYKQLFNHYADKALSSATIHPARIRRLEEWLDK
ncbi:TPM domain-containing protein [Desulfogranum marinum]|uniref:TPM domain-containing protein n=1 Tax=Desulfogranum marinum TaxID=453220 RepID=UPI0029C6AAA6|nr:TPM domain-containing protein [Desulfogranum marinum]